jgi:hypothetical protein
MYGDITRDTFDQLKHYSRVMGQQGRVSIDADANEQAAIVLHFLRTLAADLIGPFGGPAQYLGFEIANVQDSDIAVGAGRYYVDGLLCENDAQYDAAGNLLPVSFLNQADYPLTQAEQQNLKLGQGRFLVYLDVWERHISAVEDGSLREVALGGPDTATRAKVVWQVRMADKLPDGAPLPNGFGREQLNKFWNAWKQQWQPEKRGLLIASARMDTGKSDPCTMLADTEYVGQENRLYRVEIQATGDAGVATFKWSRDNGSVVFPIVQLNGAVATVEHLGRDNASGLQVDNWVEVVDDASVLRNAPRRLLQVSATDPNEMTVTLNVPNGVVLPVFDENSTTHPFLRRWDQQEMEGQMMQDGAVVTQKDIPMELEDGVLVTFKSGQAYRPGDYWQVPVRTLSPYVEWPQVLDTATGELNPQPLPPRGIEHHFAPLAVLVDGAATDLRCVIQPPIQCPAP